jgi:hypothetical protein
VTREERLRFYRREAVKSAAKFARVINRMPLDDGLRGPLEVMAAHHMMVAELDVIFKAINDTLEER